MNLKNNVYRPYLLEKVWCTGFRGLDTCPQIFLAGRLMLTQCLYIGILFIARGGCEIFIFLLSMGGGGVCKKIEKHCLRERGVVLGKKT